MNANSFPGCIVLTGIHRSATSAAAAALQSSGVFIGDVLLVPNEGNIYGYYEDVDFVLLHEDALKAMGLSKEGWLRSGTCAFRDPIRARAEALVSKRRALGRIWAWKDPRAVLFLDEWHALLPEARFVFFFRAPWEVLDSLFRRNNPGDEIFATTPDLAAAVYTLYANRMLEFAKRHPEIVLFFDGPDVVRNPAEWLAHLRDRWQVPLQDSDLSVVDPRGLRQEALPERAALLARFFPETLAAYRDLLTAAGKTVESWPEPMDDVTYAQWALRDWVVLRRTEGVLKKEREEISNLREKLDQITAEKDRWQSRALEVEAQHGRFRRWVESSVFWQLRGTILRFLNQMGWKAHIAPD